MEFRTKVYDRQKKFFYDAYRTGRIGWPRKGHSRLVDLLLEDSSLLPGSRVLDIGTGEGRNLHPLMEKDFQVIGIDLIFEPLLVARGRIGERGCLGRIAFVQADLFNLPFRSGAFDAVFDFGVFHHLRRAERKDYSRWISRILKPGGRAGLGIFSEFFKHSPDDMRRRLYVTHRGHHDVFFREPDLPALLGSNFRLEASGTEETGDGLSHYRLAVYRKMH